MKREFIELTPAKAKVFLEHNYSENRRVSQIWVNSLAQDIKEGRWNNDISEVDQGISLTSDGILINGQHRCLAVIKANKSIKIWVNYDVPMELYEYMDCGKVRNAKDYLSVPNATNIAAVAKALYGIENGYSNLIASVQGVLRNGGRDGKTRFVTTRSQIIDTAAKRKEYLQYIYSLSSKTATYLGGKRTYIAYAFLAIDYVGNGYMLNEFADECSKLHAESELIQSFRIFVMSKLATKSFKSSIDWYIGCILCCYDNFIANNSVGCFNKTNTYLQKYDALMRKQRESIREDNNNGF